MTLTKQLVASACAVLASAFLISTVEAQGLANQKTYFTFSQSVELPGGVTLPAGKYTFKLADTSGSRDVVQVFNENESKILAMFLSVSAQRREPTEDSVITFAEVPASAPQPVRYWYYPGRRDGHEFIYPLDQARRIAQLTRTRVLATDAKITDQASADEAKVQVVEPSGEVKAFEPNANRSARAERQESAASEQARTSREPAAQARAAQPQQEPSTPAPRGTSGQAPESRNARRELPATAGFDPLIGLIGLISLGGFVAARLRVR